MTVYLGIMRREPITQREFEEAIRNDPELDFASVAGTDQAEGDGFFLNHPVDGDITVILEKADGREPFRRDVVRLFKLAERLNARLRHENGSFFRTCDETYQDPEFAHACLLNDPFAKLVPPEQVAAETRREKLMMIPGGILFTALLASGYHMYGVWGGLLALFPGLLILWLLTALAHRDKGELYVWCGCLLLLLIPTLITGCAYYYFGWKGVETVVASLVVLLVILAFAACLKGRKEKNDYRRKIDASLRRLGEIVQSLPDDGPILLILPEGMRRRNSAELGSVDDFLRGRTVVEREFPGKMSIVTPRRLKHLNDTIEQYRNCRTVFFFNAFSSEHLDEELRHLEIIRNRTEDSPRIVLYQRCSGMAGHLEEYSFPDGVISAGLLLATEEAWHDDEYYPATVETLEFGIN